VPCDRLLTIYLDAFLMTFVVLLSMTICLLGLTLLPLLRYEAWWVRSLDFPRFPLSIAFVVLVSLDLMLLDFSALGPWLILVTAMACLLYQLWWILPYTPLFPVEAKNASNIDPRRRIRIMTANVLATNRDASALLKLVSDNEPDVLVTLESDAWWQSKLDALETDFSFTIKCPLDNLYGMHVYSKLPLSERRIEFLVEPDVPSMHALVTIPSGDRIRIHFLHPSPPSPTENDSSSERDAELLIVAKSVRRSSLPLIVTGDLNDVAWSATTRLFRKMSRLIDPRVGRGMFNTFHAVSDIRRLPHFGSDHFALFTALSLEPQQEKRSDGFGIDEEELRWVNEKIEDQDVSADDVPRPENHKLSRVLANNHF